MTHFKILTDPLAIRTKWRERMTFCRHVLGSCIESLESLQELYLSGNDFENSNFVREILERHQSEIEEIETVLKQLEEMDGPLLTEIQERVNKKIEGFNKKYE